MTKCNICYKHLNSVYIRKGVKGLLNRIGFYCETCRIHYDLYLKLYTVNERQYTVFNNTRIIDQLDKLNESENIINDDSDSNNNHTNPKLTIKISQVARPRFELGSKAPKASMLGHYTRH